MFDNPKYTFQQSVITVDPNAITEEIIDCNNGPLLTTFNKTNPNLPCTPHKTHTRSYCCICSVKEKSTY